MSVRFEKMGHWNLPKTMEEAINKESVHAKPKTSQTDDTQQDATALGGNYGQEENTDNSSNTEGASTGNEQLQGNYGQDGSQLSEAQSKFEDFRNRQIENGSLKG
jgi:hypothetical protein